jgi:Spy/CpxP family protein refolding chaperone
VNTWKAILAVLVIFGAGLVTGMVLNKVSVNPKPAASVRPPGTRSQKPLSLEQLRKVELMMRVQKDLDLTPEQRVRIEKIIGDGQGRIRDLWQQVEPDIYDEYQDVRTKFCAELTPEQRQRYDELMKQQLHRPKPASTNAPPPAATP